MRQNFTAEQVKRISSLLPMSLEKIKSSLTLGNIEKMYTQLTKHYTFMSETKIEKIIASLKNEKVNHNIDGICGYLKFKEDNLQVNYIGTIYYSNRTIDIHTSYYNVKLPTQTKQTAIHLTNDKMLVEEVSNHILEKICLTLYREYKIELGMQIERQIDKEIINDVTSILESLQFETEKWLIDYYTCQFHKTKKYNSLSEAKLQYKLTDFVIDYLIEVQNEDNEIKYELSMYVNHLHGEINTNYVKQTFVVTKGNDIENSISSTVKNLLGITKIILPK